MVDQKMVGPEVLDRVFQVVKARKTADPDTSYVANLYKKGRLKIAEKLGEEATETIIASIAQDDQALIGESADLLFHLLILWAERGLDPAQVYEELARRQGVSGLDEKASRPA